MTTLPFAKQSRTVFLLGWLEQTGVSADCPAALVTGYATGMLVVGKDTPPYRENAEHETSPNLCCAGVTNVHIQFLLQERDKALMSHLRPYRPAHVVCGLFWEILALPGGCGLDVALAAGLLGLPGVPPGSGKEQARDGLTAYRLTVRPVLSLGGTVGGMDCLPLCHCKVCSPLTPKRQCCAYTDTINKLL